MAKLTTQIVRGDEEVTLGPLGVPLAVFTTLGAEDVNGRGIVLANDRIKFMAEVNGKLVNFVASVYIQRDPLDDDEAAKVTKMAADREAKKRQKAEDEKRELAAKLEAARKIGAEGVMDGIKIAQQYSGVLRNLGINAGN